MMSFDFLFSLITITEILDRIEILNTDLQNSHLSVCDSLKKVEAVSFHFDSSRDFKFKVIWKKCHKAIDNVKVFDIDGPKFPRTRKILKRFDQGQSETHVFQSVHEWYRKKYFTLYDQVTASLKRRFDTEDYKFLKSLEIFATGSCTNEDKIFEFYEKDSDKERLLSDRRMLFVVLKRSRTKVKSGRYCRLFKRKSMLYTTCT